MRRFRQITANILRRQFLAERKQKSLISWQTRTLATFVAGGYMTDGKGNPAVESAMEIALDDIEKAELEDMKIAAANKPLEAKPGSYERLTKAFGGGRI